MEDFAIRLRTAIERRGIQQKNLAAAIKLSPARLSNYVNGHSEPSLDILFSLCRELNVSSDYLIGLTDAFTSAAAPMPVSIVNSSVPRDPFDDLTPEQRAAIELSLKAFREANAAKAKEA